MIGVPVLRAFAGGEVSLPGGVRNQVFVPIARPTQMVMSRAARESVVMSPLPGSVSSDCVYRECFAAEARVASRFPRVQLSFVRVGRETRESTITQLFAASPCRRLYRGRCER
jgi:hypothetical protein